jgi:choline kinase
LEGVVFAIASEDIISISSGKEIVTFIAAADRELDWVWILNIKLTGKKIIKKTIKKILKRSLNKIVGVKVDLVYIKAEEVVANHNVCPIGTKETVVSPAAENNVISPLTVEEVITVSTCIVRGKTIAKNDVVARIIRITTSIAIDYVIASKTEQNIVRSIG